MGSAIRYQMEETYCTHIDQTNGNLPIPLNISIKLYSKGIYASVQSPNAPVMQAFGCYATVYLTGTQKSDES